MLDPNRSPALDHYPNFSPNLDKKLANELSTLHDQQFRALQNAVFIPMSTKETQEYEQRRARIRTISGQFGSL
jgi:hypothetical protein